MSEPEIPHTIAGPAAVLSRRYAAALYDTADSAKQLEAVVADMRVLRAAFDGNKEFKTFSKNPRMTRSQLAAAGRKVAEAAKVGKIAETFLEVLGQNRRLALAGDIIAMFLYEVHRRHGEQTAEVFTAKALTAEHKSSLETSLGKITGRKIDMVVREDKSLLGGFIVRVGSIMIDASLRGKLSRIERGLKTQNKIAAA